MTSTPSSGITEPTARQEGDKANEHPERKPFQPVVEVSSLMAGHGLAFGKVGDALSNKEAEHRLKEIGKWSDVVAELSNVHTRYDRERAYLEMAAATRTIALELAGAARAATPDEAALETLFKKLDRSCEACHDSDY